MLLAEAGIQELGPRLSARGATVVDVAGLVVCPGFIDLRAHLGEPGHEDRETIRTGTRAAAAGGFTAVCAMPGSDPVNDHAGLTRALLDRARLEGVTRVYPVGALSRGLRGEELAEYGDLRDAGCVAVGDDGRPVPERPPAPPRPRVREGLRPRGHRLLRRAHPRGQGGHERGPRGHPPRPAGQPRGGGVAGGGARLQLAELTGSRLHVARVSTAASVDAIRRAKARGVRVTAEATPHHLLLTDQQVKDREYDTATKVKPPLRSEPDRRALIDGLRDGTIDCIATDHSPHTQDDKKVEYDLAAFGVSSLETAVALGLDRLVHSGVLELEQLVALFSTNPARAFGLPGGSLKPGAPADVTLLDLSRKQQVDPKRLRVQGPLDAVRGGRAQGLAGDDGGGGEDRVRGAGAKLERSAGTVRSGRKVVLPARGLEWVGRSPTGGRAGLAAGKRIRRLPVKATAFARHRQSRTLLAVFGELSTFATTPQVINLRRRRRCSPAGFQGAGCEAVSTAVAAHERRWMARRKVLSVPEGLSASGEGA